MLLARPNVIKSKHRDTRDSWDSSKTAGEQQCITLSIIISCFNEERTLEQCVERVEALARDDLRLEIIIVDDCSTDRSAEIARSLAQTHPNIKVFCHQRNQGKGAALRMGFRAASGDYVAIQDADLEYDPRDLEAMSGPLRSGKADVVIGSRFLGCGPHRVLYFWHYVGNAMLTFISNMFTDLNLTDMESCYKVFRREVIQSIQIQEDRFGFEPEIIAKVAHMGVPIYETGISYAGRTYEEGKKIGVRDGFRALYCIFLYNAYRVPLPIQFAIYLFIGGASAVVNLAAFLLLQNLGIGLSVSLVAAFVLAAAFKLPPLRSAIVSAQHQVEPCGRSGALCGHYLAGPGARRFLYQGMYFYGLDSLVG